MESGRATGFSYGVLIVRGKSTLHTHTQTYAHTQTYTHIHTHAHTNICTHTQTYTHINTHAHTTRTHHDGWSAGSCVWGGQSSFPIRQLAVAEVAHLFSPKHRHREASELPVGNKKPYD